MGPVLVRDTSIFPNPDKFDGRCFLSLRCATREWEQTSICNKNPRNDFLGHRSHACPERFLASNKLKLFLPTWSCTMTGDLQRAKQGLIQLWMAWERALILGRRFCGNRERQRLVCRRPLRVSHLFLVGYTGLEYTGKQESWDVRPLFCGWSYVSWKNDFR